MMFSLKNLALYGLATFGLWKAYEASPLQIGGQHKGQRGSLQEAYMWEMGGHPSHTDMLGRRSRR